MECNVHDIENKAGIYDTRNNIQELKIINIFWYDSKL
jgi:hypothetical protein